MEALRIMKGGIMATATVSEPGLNRSEATYRGLRRFNLIMAFLHLVQGILMIVLSNDTTYPVYTYLFHWDLIRH